MDQQTRKKLYSKAGIDPKELDEQYDRDREMRERQLKEKQVEMRRRFAGS